MSIPTPPPNMFRLTITALAVTLASATLWPLPKQITTGSTTLPIPNGSFNFVGQSENDSDLAVKRYIPLIFPHSVDESGDALDIQGEFPSILNPNPAVSPHFPKP